MSRPRTITLLLALVTLVAYFPAAGHGFLNLDDDLYVTYNWVVRHGLTWAGAKWAFTTWHASNWHPLTWLSHMLDCELFGLDARGHHSISILLHTANTVLLLRLLWRLTRDLWPSAFVAALFAWHPISVESAAWIAERKNVLSTFFGLLSLLAYTSYAQKHADVQSRREQSPLHLRPFDYSLALCFFALSLMSKPMLVTLPFVMLLLDYWPLQRYPDSALRIPRLLRLAREKWPFFLLIAPACIFTVLAQHNGGMVGSLEQFPLGLRLCNAFRSCALYLWTAVWPANLAILYPYPLRSHLPAAAAPAAALLIAVTWLVWRAHVRYPYLLVGWLWFLGTLVPAIGIVQVGQQAMNDHHAYVPLIGIFIAVAFGSKDLITHFQIGVVSSAAAAGVILGTCLLHLEHQLSYWRNDETLFTRALAVTKDNGAAHNNLGVALAKQGRQAEARTHFQEAIRLNPVWADPHHNLGNVLRDAGRPEEALVEYRKAVQLKPGQPIMQENLGEALARLGRPDEALSHLNQAARLEPAYAWPHFQIAKVLLQQGRDAEAIAQCGEALRLNPNDSEVLAFTARVLSAEADPKLRDGQTALALALKACALGSGEPYVLDVLGMAFAETGDFEQAQTTASKAIQLAATAKPGNLEQWRQRLELYKKSQPWHESFLLTNTPPNGIPKE